MPYYRCRIVNDRGETEDLRLRADTPAALQTHIERDGRFLVSWQEESGRRTVGRIRRRDLHLFTRELQILLESGMTVPDALTAAGEQLGASGLQHILQEMSGRIREGVSLSAAFAAHDKVFGRFYVESLRAGEESGKLTTILGRLAEHEKRSYRLRERIIQALAYPAVLVAVSLGVLAFLLFFVLPSFQVVFRDLQLDPPLATRWLFALTAFLREGGMILLVLAVALLALAGRSRSLQARLSGLPVRLPLVGGILARYEIARFASTFSLLLAGGMPALDALRSASSVPGRAELRERLAEAARSLTRGLSLTESLRQSASLDPLALRLVHVGERSGSLAPMLETVATIYEEEIDHEIEVTASLVEPLLLLFMGLVIGTIIVMVFLPVVRMSMVV